MSPDLSQISSDTDQAEYTGFTSAYPVEGRAP